MKESLIGAFAGFIGTWMVMVVFRLGDIRDELRKIRRQGNRS
jgi:hypothetical protein